MELFTENGYGIARMRIRNSDGNYNYVVWCADTPECAVIDPLDAAVVLDFIRTRGLTVKYIINTHTHPDHIKGNEAVSKVTNAKILVHPIGKASVSLESETVEEGGVIHVGKRTVRVIHTPGHCPEHISLIWGESIFTGDTLFLAGCGNTRNRGNVEQLYESIAFKIRPLPENFRVFAGHDYSEANLRFALSVEPQNGAASAKLDGLRSARSQGKEPYPTTIAEEKRYNPFLRFDDPELVMEMKKKKPSLEDNPRTVFKELRRLRDNWK